MRTITAAQQGVLDSGVQAEHLRISVKDAGGTFRDLTSYPGFNAVISCSIAADVNDPHMTFEAELSRRLFDLSLSPLMADSALNRGFNPAASFAALIAIRREVKIEVAIVAADAQPESGDWFEVFRGHIDRYNLAAGPHITIAGRDLGGKLATTHIKKERVYAFAADSGTPVSLRIWTPEMVAVAGEYVVPATRGDGTGGTPDPGYNKFFKCATGGTTGTAEPTWTTGSGIADGSVAWDYKGAPITSGFAVETMMQLLLDDNPGASAGTMVVDGSPSWTVGQWLEQRGPLLDAVRKLATQNGWDFRSKWHAGSSSFRFTLYEPDRASPTSAHTFARPDYLELRSLEADIANVRNSIDVIYEDKTVLWPDGSTIRKAVHDEDAGSIAANGELWAEIQEDELSNIDTEPEAERYAAAFISDCAQPDYSLATDLTRGFPWLELNDYLTFVADDDHISADQSLALTSARQSWSGGHLTTSVQLRGKPTLGSKVHIERVQHPRRPPRDRPHRLTHFQGTTTPTARIERVVGGARIGCGLDLDKGRLVEEYEHHVYESSGATLSSATLATVTKDRAIDLASLESGKTYYERVIARTRNEGKLVRGQPSVEVAFTAGYLEPHHVHPEKFRGEFPPNGSFEGQFRTTQPPDRWSMVTGTWSTDVSSGVVKGGPSPADGARYLIFATTSVAAKVRSDYFPVSRTHVYELLAQVYRVSGDNDYTLEVEWYDGTKASISTSTLTVDLAVLTTSAWNLVRAVFAAPSGAALGRFAIAKATAHSNAAYIDACKLIDRGEPWADLPTGNFTNSWADGPSGVAVGYRAENGRGWLMGSMASGTVNLDAFTLPANLAPSHEVQIAVPTNTGHGKLRINTSGQVRLISGGNTEVWLDGVSWPLS